MQPSRLRWSPDGNERGQPACYDPDSASDPPASRIRDWTSRGQEHRLVAAYHRIEPEHVPRFIERVDSVLDIATDDWRLVFRVSRPELIQANSRSV